MNGKLKILFIIFGVLTIIALFVLQLKGQTLEYLPARALIIEVTNLSSVEPQPSQLWTFAEKIEEARQLVESSNLELKVGTREYVYYENRITRNSKGSISVVKKRLTDPDREIALVLMDLDTGKLDLIKITERGNAITAPPGYEIENVTRLNGITNNAWNTQRRVIKPANQVVILNVWPYFATKKVPQTVKSKGKSKTRYVYKKVIEHRMYVPFSDELAVQELIDDGKKFRKELVRKAMDGLRENGVRSRAYPDELIADGQILKPEFFERLPLIEQADYGEFVLNPEAPLKRVDVIIGTNKETAYSYTCSRAKACGLLQYTKGTYNAMRKKYPAAQLNPDFEAGYKDPVNLMIAAILLHDNNLTSLITSFGKEIVSDVNFVEEMLAANYNGGTGRPYRSLNASMLKNLTDWLTGYMRLETRQYIEKLRYIRESYA